MRNSGSKVIAFVLITLGVLFVLGKITPFLGHFFGYLFSLVIALAVIGLGYYGIRRGNALFGWIVLIIGVLFLLSKLMWLLIPVIGIGLILYGISKFKNNRR